MPAFANRNMLFFAVLAVLIAAVAGWWLYDRYRIAPEPELASLPLTDLDGQPIDPASLAGKAVVVNFWQTWCPPCRQEMPDLDAARKALEPEGFVFVLVSDEPAALIRDFQQKKPNGLTYWRTESLAALDVHTYPTTLLYDRNGAVVYKKVGVEPWASTAMLNRFRELVQ
jgi:thiol-disulfide isomerase/thioredoxin